MSQSEKKQNHSCHLSIITGRAAERQTKQQAAGAYHRPENLFEKRN